MSGTYTIYTITNTANGRIYIGSSKDVKKRWMVHKYDLNNNCHINPRLLDDWNLFSEAAFEFKVIESGLDQVSAVEKENELLARYFDNGIACYNSVSKSNSRPKTKPRAIPFWKKV